MGVMAATARRRSSSNCVQRNVEYPQPQTHHTVTLLSVHVCGDDTFPPNPGRKLDHLPNSVCHQLGLCWAVHGKLSQLCLHRLAQWQLHAAGQARRDVCQHGCRWTRRAP